MQMPKATSVGTCAAVKAEAADETLTLASVHRLLSEGPLDLPCRLPGRAAFRAAIVGKVRRCPVGRDRADDGSMPCLWLWGVRRLWWFEVR